MDYRGGDSRLSRAPSQLGQRIMTSELSSKIKATSKNEARAISEVDGKSDKREEDDVSRHHLLAMRSNLDGGGARYIGGMKDREAVSAFLASRSSSAVLVRVQRACIVSARI